MKISSIRYFFKEAFRGVYKNSLMSFASVVTVASCIFIIISSYLIASNLKFNLKNSENSLVTMIYINDEVPANKVIDLEDDIRKMDNVARVEYISPEQSYANYKKELGARAYILEGLPPESLLRRSFSVKLVDGTKGKAFAESFSSQIGVDKDFSSVNQPQKQADYLEKISGGITIGSIILIIGFGFISVIIIMNTIKITLSNREAEINIMKYIGATDWFIRLPLIIEGVIIGFIGSLIPIALSMVSYNKITIFVTQKLHVISADALFLKSSQVFAVIIPVSITVGILLGVVGSMTSIRKYLKV